MAYKHFSDYRVFLVVSKEYIIDLQCFIMDNNNIDLNLLVIFSKVLELGSFTKAAQALRRPKSRISRAISKLEYEVGAQLIRRTTRKISPTSQGLEFFKAISPLINGIQSEMTALRNSQDEMVGNLRVTAPQDLGQNIVTKIISKFIKIYPGVKVETIITNDFLDLTKENIDLCFRAGKLHDSSLIQKLFMKTDFTIVASKSYIEKFGAPKKLDDLNKHHFLSFNGKEKSWLKEVKDINPIVKSDSFPMILSMVLNDDGIGILPTLISHKYIKSGEILQLFPDWKSPTDKIHFVYQKGNVSSKILKAFINTASDFSANFRKESG